ncbi:MAG TPA: histidine kinase dimerization/phosphoacceptor domain -containing protein [Armatimonadota bacterium]
MRHKGRDRAIRPQSTSESIPTLPREFPPSPEWRAAQHRVRNDLQTIGALWRIARRRATSDELAEAFPSWLNALAAIYDSLPLWQSDERVAIGDLLAALRSRCDFGAQFEFELIGETCVPAQMAVAGALAVSDLLSFSAASSEPGSIIKVTTTSDNDVTRIETAFVSRPTPADWPPLGLAVAAEAVGAQYASHPDGDQAGAVLVMPWH